MPVLRATQIYIEWQPCQLISASPQLSSKPLT
jgi:hypothetical protein